MTDPAIHLRVFGTPGLSHDAGTPDAPGTLPSGKPLALVTFLACAPARSATREQLIDLLWADSERDSARHTLRQTLWYVRRRLGVSPFSTSADTVTLEASLVCDRDEFLAALDVGDLARAVERYSGDFFPGFAAPGGAEFEQWADIERARLRGLYVRAAESVVRDRLRTEPARELVPLARRVRELVPASQSAWRLLLEVLLAADDRISALVEADQLEQWLTRDELSVEAATVSMLRLVRSDAMRPAGREEASEALTAELVGREQELSRLLTAWEQARDGHPSHLHLMARAGFGKTRLLDGLARRLRATRARVVVIRAVQANRALPFALAADLTLALARLRGAAGISPDAASALVSLAPGVSTYLSAEPDRAAGDEALRRRTLALKELVHTIADDAPLALLVDDLHWADAGSRAMLASLSAGLGSAPVLLVTAGRFAEPAPGSTVDTLELGALTSEQVTALLESLGSFPAAGDAPNWSAQLAGRLHAASGGSPLLVLETLQLALERGLLRQADGVWQCPDAPGLDALLDGGSAIRQRLLDVPEAQQATLVLLSVFGNVLDTASVRRVLGDEGAGALQPLELRGFVMQQEDGWRIAHDEIAELVRELAAPDDLVRAERDSARILESREPSDAPPLLLRAAQHRRAAGDMRELRQLFARLVRASAADGDRQAIQMLAQDVLGVSAGPGERRALVQSLPWRLRANVERVFVGASIAAAVLLTMAVQVQERSAATPVRDVSLLLPAVRGGDTVLLEAQVDHALLGTGADIRAEIMNADPRAVRALARLSGVLDRWGDTVVGGSLEWGDRYGLELVQVDLATGTSRRLTESPTDDYGFSRSPDGRFAAFSSARHDTVHERAGVYVLDRNSGSVRSLTTSRHFDGQARWSPDGSRIAFLRRFATPEPTTICWITPSGTDETCLAPPDTLEVMTLQSWDSPNSVLVTVEPLDVANPLLARLDLRDGRVAVLRPRGGGVLHRAIG